MPTVDYTFYTDNYGGALPQTTFEQYLIRARAAINSLTHCRIDKIWDRLTAEQQDAIRYTLCAFVDNIYQNAQAGGRQILTEIVGSHHVTLAQDTRSRQLQLLEIAKQYMGCIQYQGKSLFFRGIDRRCCCC